MHQLFALFRQPADPAAFDRAYRETHLPLARKIPGLISLDVFKTLPAREGAAPFYQIAVLTFTDKDSFKTAMKSPENAAAGANLMGFAKDIVEFHSTESVDLP